MLFKECALYQKIESNRGAVRWAGHSIVMHGQKRWKQSFIPKWVGRKVHRSGIPSTEVAVVILTGDCGELLIAASLPGRSAAYVKLGEDVKGKENSAMSKRACCVRACVRRQV